MTAILPKSRPSEKHDFRQDPAILPSPRSPRAAATVPRCLTRVLVLQTARKTTQKMEKAVVQNVIMPTVRVAVVVFCASACSIFCVVFRAVCSASTRARRRGTVAAARGERGDGKIAGPSRKSCFSAGQVFGRIAVKKSSASYFIF